MTATEAGQLGGAALEGRIRRSRAARSRVSFALGAALADCAAIVASALVVGWAYHLGARGELPFNDSLLQIGAAVALLVLLPNVLRNEYQMAGYLEFRGHARRSFHLWNLAFVVAIVLGFLTKTSVEFSRGTVVLFYAGGFAALILTRYLVVRLTQISVKTGAVAARRIYLVGFEEQVMGFASRHQPWNLGMEIAGIAILPSADDALAAERLAAAAAETRSAAPDDVIILIPWARTDLVEAAITQFLTVPSAVHLGGEPVLERFHDIRIARTGSVASMQIVRRPMTIAEVALKRAFDLIAATAALVLLAPLFAAVALAIKLDSHGPVFFKQRRFGFNQQPFRIWKFRTMLTLDDGDVVRQAQAADPRITRVGRFLRRWNIDELPQLLNVLRGEMSLVGPRPHALAHDREFEQRIALYARRHNVKPGITGWAQVNGFRGETDTDAKMQARVEHDLHYIDHWSFGLDLLILVRTVVSPKAYRNAG
jgi:Undecaprenyl-phosphate glucose phosphotransferase